jgi:hypothetical protein
MMRQNSWVDSQSYNLYGQAVPGGGLFQVGYWRWHATLRCAWRGQAVSEGGVLKGCSRRHETL